MSPVLTKINTKGDNNMTGYICWVAIVTGLFNLEMLLRCAMFISHEPLIWGKIDFFLPFCLMMRLLENNSVTCIKIIMEFC